MAHILVADDDPGMCILLVQLLRKCGHKIESVSSTDELLAAMRRWRPNVAIVDLWLGSREEGIRAILQLQEQHPPIPTIVISADADVAAAVEVMRLGAADFIGKPIAPATLIKSVDDVLARAQGRKDPDSPQIIGKSAALLAALDQAARFAVPDISILLTGDTGVGKEQFAKLVHAHSKRAAMPFVPVDCSALPESLFESEFFGYDKRAFTGAAGARQGLFDAANHGTLFLDEIGNLPLPLQAKLLRILQERRVRPVGSQQDHGVDVRIIAATNVNLRESSRSGRFREDLFYRLAEITIDLPRLRDRHGDVPLLARHFLDLYNRRFQRRITGFTDEAVALLSAHDWPGNVRELESTVKSAVVLAADVIGVEHLPESIRESGVVRSLRVEPAAGCTLTALPEREQDAPTQTEFQMALPSKNEQFDLKLCAGDAAAYAESALLRQLVDRFSPSATELARMVNVDAKTLRTKLRRFQIELRREGLNSQ